MYKMFPAHKNENQWVKEHGNWKLGKLAFGQALKDKNEFFLQLFIHRSPGGDEHRKKYTGTKEACKVMWELRTTRQLFQLDYYLLTEAEEKGCQWNSNIKYHGSDHKTSYAIFEYLQDEMKWYTKVLIPAKQ